ncbi:thymidine phosphorylase [bacterium]|nr:thymidine phosphorylase [bacterium]
MNPVALIEKKRNGAELSDDEIRWIVNAYTSGHMPDYQMSAMLMAIYFQGMNRDELVSLTRCMIESGNVMDLSGIPGRKIDKHSTGGVGDKVSLVLAPLMAAAGVVVPMMAGRGLGHTGGTLDKLEAIPGFQVRLSESQFKRQLKEIGCAIMGQTEHVAPADRQLYALRDVTGTVPSIPLICSSILSKKKAEGAEGLVLDVKIGKGAFLPTRKQTIELAGTLVDIGNALGIQTQALITNMDEPLGNAIGNWLETREAVNALQGNGPEDLMQVTLALGSVMLVLAGLSGNYNAAVRDLQRLINSGRALEKFEELIRTQGGDLTVIRHPDTYKEAKFAVDVTAARDGIIHGIDARQLGMTAVSLGAGRMKKEDAVDPKAGILLHKKTGDSVRSGERIMSFYTDRPEIREMASRELTQAVSVRPDSVQRIDLVERLISQDRDVLYSELN